MSVHVVGWLLIPILIALSWPPDSDALPRFAVANETTCNSCHISPTGGGMRNEFGNYSVAYQELALPSSKKLLSSRYKSPRISEALQVGFDSRYLVFDDLSVFRMQTDVYAALTPVDGLVWQARFSETGITEAYALATIDNDHFYVRAGRFYPSYGLKVADHKAFIRERSGHRSNLYLDGLSVGFQQSGFSVAAELFDNNTQGIYGLNVSKSFSFRSISLYAGGSLQFAEQISGQPSLLPDGRALYAGVNYDRFTILGEVDLTGRSNDSLIAYSSFTARIEHGLYFITEYNFFDGNRDLKGSVDEYVRLSVELFPIPFVQVRPSYTYYTRGSKWKEDDLFLQLHIGY